MGASGPDPAATAAVSATRRATTPMPFVPKVPFSGKEGLVAMALQFFCDGHFLVGEVVPVAGMEQLVCFLVRLSGDPVRDVDPNRMTTRHDTCPGWRANRTGGVSVVELHALFGQTVYVWGFVKGRAKGAHVHHSHVVDQKEEKVGWPVLG